MICKSCFCQEYSLACHLQRRKPGLEHTNLLVRDGVIDAIGAISQPPEAEVLDASHMILYPGLINTHHHLYQTFSRNLPQVQHMELFPGSRRSMRFGRT